MLQGGINDGTIVLFSLQGEGLELESNLETPAPGEYGIIATPVPLHERLRRHQDRLSDLRQHLARLQKRRSLRQQPISAAQELDDPGPVRLHPSRQPAPVLSKKEQRRVEDRLCTAGMRNPSKVVSRWPTLRSGMLPVRTVISKFLSDHPEASNLSLACGLSPLRQPPPSELVSELRRRLAVAFSIDPDRVEDHHTASPLKYRLFQSVISATKDPDMIVGRWLEEGAPMGIRVPVAPGGHFPKSSCPAELEIQDLPSVFRFAKNHASFVDLYGEAEPPTLGLIRSYIARGYGEVFASLEAAQEKYGELVQRPWVTFGSANVMAAGNTE